MLIPWSSALILLSITYGVFVLIGVRGLCGVINDRLVALREIRATGSPAGAIATEHDRAPLHLVRPGFTPAVLAQA